MTTPTLTYYRDLVHTLVAKELKVRYKNTFLGYIWSLLNPLAFAAVYCYVFEILMPNSTEQYLLFFTAALFPWQWFANAVGAANGFFVGNGTLIKKVRFPRIFLVFAGVLNDSVHFITSLPVIVLIMLFYHVHPGVAWLWGLPLLLVTQLFITTGMCLIVATANLYFRDLERLIGILLQLWMFGSPVLYGADKMLHGRSALLLFLNPMGCQLACWRELFMNKPLTSAYLGVAVFWSISLYVMGYLLYRALQARFAELV